MPTDPTPDSILAVLLDATADIHTATASARADLSHLEDELDHLPTGFPLARAILTERHATLAGQVVTATREAIARAAARLSLRTGPDGECDIDKPAIRPKGPPTKAEKAARGASEPKPPESPPVVVAEQEPPAPGLDGVALFAAAIKDRAPQSDLDPLGWTADGPGEALTDAQTRTLVKHRISFDDLDTWEDGAPFAFGRAWTMADAAREVPS